MNLLRPAALPDEIAHGYEGRVLRLNGWSDRTQALRSLMRCSDRDGAKRRELSTVELLASVAGIETSQFVRDHTMMPLRRAVTSIKPGIPHGSACHAELLRTTALRAIRPHAYFCLQCAEEDLDFHGTPFWRREHQMPGMFWCSKHGSALSYVEPSTAFASSPTEFTVQRQAVSETWTEALKESAAVRRFHAICTDLLARNHSLDEDTVSKAARTRALELDLHVGRGAVRRLLLSDLVKRSFNKMWLDSLIPGLTETPADEYWPTLDSALLGKRAGVATVSYALAFSVLFESADEAINAMLAPLTHRNLQGSNQPGERHVSDDELREAFIESRGNHAEVAQRLQLNRDQAKRRLDRIGLPTLRGLEAQALRQTIAAVLLEDVPISRACSANGLSLPVATAALQRALQSLESALGLMTQTKIRRPLGPKPRPLPPPRQQGRTLVEDEAHRRRRTTAVPRQATTTA